MCNIVDSSRKRSLRKLLCDFFPNESRKKHIYHSTIYSWGTCCCFLNLSARENTKLRVDEKYENSGIFINFHIKSFLWYFNFRFSTFPISLFHPEIVRERCKRGVGINLQWSKSTRWWPYHDYPNLSQHVRRTLHDPLLSARLLPHTRLTLNPEGLSGWPLRVNHDKPSTWIPSQNNLDTLSSSKLNPFH